ncbi:hypothetical protein KR009_010366 [Drosophila setifemur]|nr:hypothetical protein KR009_010366 [Drosophila setifemur]
MEAHRSCLLAAVRPYLMLFSIFAITPPVQSFERNSSKRFWFYLMAGFSCYALVILLMVIYECYVNIVALNRELQVFQVEDFSKVMGSTQKVLIPSMTICSHLNMLLNYRRLKGIYEDIANLEVEIDNAAKDFGGPRHSISFRLILALQVGLWIIVMTCCIPIFTLVALGPYVNWPNKILTECVIIMMQLQSPQYCVFVMLIHELVLRLRHTLLTLQEELMDTSRDRDQLQELCVALRCNQTLLGQIWRLVGDLGSYFSLPMIILFFYNSLTILHVINWAYIKMINPKDCCTYSGLIFLTYLIVNIICFTFLVRLGTCLLLLINLLMACLHSECCIRTYNCFPRLLHEMRRVASDVQMLKLGLREYSLQMQHLQLRFNCCGFFNINLKYFGGVVITLVGYIIIIMQFKLQAFAEAKYKSNFNLSESFIQV